MRPPRSVASLRGKLGRRPDLPSQRRADPLRPAASRRLCRGLSDDADVDGLVERLTAIHNEAQARRPAPPPGEDLAEIRRTRTPYEAAQAIFEARDERLRELESWADRLATEILPPLPTEDRDGAMLALLRALQHQILRHPVAFRAAAAALIEEGREFAKTPEGAVWKERLQHSAWLPRARLLLKMTSLSMLEEGPVETLPSAYLDALFQAAGREDVDQVLDRLFGQRKRRKDDR